MGKRPSPGSRERERLVQRVGDARGGVDRVLAGRLTPLTVLTNNSTVPPVVQWIYRLAAAGRL